MSGGSTTAEKQELADAYESRFGNFDEILHPAIMMAPAFLELLKTAIDRSAPLTRAEVEKAFPDVSWDW